MNTWKKISLIYFSSIVFLAIMTLVLFRLFMLRDFAALEQKIARQGLDGGYKMLHAEGMRLSQILKDYAAWSSTCRFIKEPNREYRQENLRSEVFSDLDINFMVFLDPGGRWCEGAFYDPSGKKMTVFPQLLKDYILTHRSLWENLKIGDSVNGFIRPLNELFAIASAPVSTESRTGPIQGFMLMGRTMSADKIAAIGNTLHHQVALVRYPDPTWAQIREVSFREQGENRILVARPVMDITGVPVMILIYAGTRDIYRNGLATFNRFMLWYASSSTVLFLVILTYLYRSVFSPMRNASQRLSSFLAHLRPELPSATSTQEPLRMLIEMAEKSVGMLEMESEARDRIISEVPVGILIVDPERNIREVNRKALQMCGYESADELLGKKCDQFFCRDQKCVIKDGVGLNGDYLETYLYNKNGERLPVLKTASRININGEILYFEGFIDLSLAGAAAGRMDHYQQRLEKMVDDLQQMNSLMHQELETHRRAKTLPAKQKEDKSSRRMSSFFFSSVSDEIRVPLNVLMETVDLLMDEHLSREEQLHHVKDVARNAVKLYDLLNMSIDIAKLDCGLIHLEQQELHLDVELAEIYDHAAVKYRDRKEIMWRFAPPAEDLGWVIVGDQEWFRRAVGQLIDNAFKFSHMGRIELGYEPEGAREVKIFIRDHGIGIADEKKKTIFDFFAQAGSESEQRYHGIGLGLSLCSRVCCMMGGRIGVESEPGRGTCFNLIFPCRQDRKKSEN